MSNETKQTAVEWLCMKLANKLGIPHAILFYVDNEKEILEAKEMEKKQTMNFALDYMMQSKPVVDFYNETYGGNK